MKTLEEFAKEIDESKELQKAAEEIKDKAALVDFLKSNDCAASADEFLAFIKSKNEGEIGDDAAKAVAGGLPWSFRIYLKDHKQEFK